MYHTFKVQASHNLNSSYMYVTHVQWKTVHGNLLHTGQRTLITQEHEIFACIHTQAVISSGHTGF